MSEYEWESGPLPRGPRPGIPGIHRSRHHELEVYVALECPRESVAWLLRPGEPLEEGARSARPVPVTKAVSG